MQTKTTVGRRLKRLAKEYADAKVDFSWEGYASGDGDDGGKSARDRVREARRKLHDAIDELTRVALGPHAVEDYP